MIEALAHFDAQHIVEYAEVDEHSCIWRDRTGHSDLTDITVPMKALARAASKDALVLFVRPVRPAIAVGGGERDATGEVGGHDTGARCRRTGARCRGTRCQKIRKAKRLRRFAKSEFTGAGRRAPGTGLVIFPELAALG